MFISETEIVSYIIYLLKNIWKLLKKNLQEIYVINQCAQIYTNTNVGQHHHGKINSG